jgi:DNA-binding NtrC family response regulator
MTTAVFTRALDVLVVDDEAPVRDVLTAFLTIDGHRATTAANGREGLDRFQEGTYDVVVTDCAMPELFGDQLAAAIKELSPRTPVILITGFGDLMRQAEEHPGGVDVVISKPFRLSHFRETLASVVN